MYPIAYIASFWCGNILLIGNLKNKSLPKYAGAICGQTTPSLSRKVKKMG